MRRHVAPALHTDSSVSSPVDHESWHPNRRKNTADINLAIHVHESLDGCWAGTESLIATPPALEGGVICARRREFLDTAAGPPCLLDVAEECSERLLGRKPVGKP